MQFLLQANEDVATLIAEMTDRPGRPGPRRLVSHDRLQALATESGMVLVFVGDLQGEPHTAERPGAGHYAEAVEAALSAEIKTLADSYRKMIRDELPSGRNLAVKTALNRVRVQEQFLATLDMADQGEACELLGLSRSNPSATLRRKEDRGELIRIDRDGRPFYPLFQFDVDGGRIHPVIREINRLRPAHWSNMRVCYWLTRAHADFGCPPAELLGRADEEILDAFRRAIEPETHG